MRIIIFICILFSLNLAQAKTIYYSKSEVSVVVPYVDTDGDMIAEPITFVFPRDVKAVKNKSLFMIHPEDRSDPNYSRLSVIPMIKKGVQRITFSLSDGQIIKVKAKIVSNPKNWISEYQFSPREALAKKKRNGLNISDLDVMKAIFNGEVLLNFKYSSVNRRINCGYWGLYGRLIKVYVGKETKGYVITLSNRTKNKEYKIDLSKIYFKGQDLNRSIITHSPYIRLVPKKYGQSNTILRIVADSSVHIKNGQICNKSEQVFEKEYVSSKSKKEQKK